MYRLWVFFQEKTFRHILKNDLFNDVEKIEGLELFGAHQVIYQNNLDKAIDIWIEALEYRYQIAITVNSRNRLI